ncbi:hypothetical protein QMK17_24505 [Rhodococcus sp. G-MC3]|uniref:hypothetical protein n=1 Tax=Rhodococcus sp. G-MC3 TaxID=3046209 RepID=UPI0024BAA272|nr:hypothetical protein [Rhodococcus sp. G-MC3]MDJ0396469.1 hypothetical protein [Rhodococcus sp. G-MC3]
MTLRAGVNGFTPEGVLHRGARLVVESGEVVCADVVAETRWPTVTDEDDWIEYHREWGSALPATAERTAADGDAAAAMHASKLWSQHRDHTDVPSRRPS